MIRLKSQNAFHGWLEQAFMIGLLVFALVQIAFVFGASDTVVKKDMHISALLDVKKPAVVADKDAPPADTSSRS